MSEKEIKKAKEEEEEDEEKEQEKENKRATQLLFKQMPVVSLNTRTHYRSPYRGCGCCFNPTDFVLVEESRRIPNPIAVIVIGYTLRDLTAVHLLHTGTHLTHRELACTAQLLAVVFTSTGQCVPSQRFYRQKAKLHDPRALACGRPRLLLPAAAERCGGFPRTNRFKHDPGRTVTTACCALGTAAPSARSPAHALGTTLRLDTALSCFSLPALAALSDPLSTPRARDAETGRQADTVTRAATPTETGTVSVHTQHELRTSNHTASTTYRECCGLCYSSACKYSNNTVYR